MGDFRSLKGKASKKYRSSTTKAYARGGRVAPDAPGKRTVININVAPAAAPEAAAAPAMPPAPPPVPPVPPASGGAGPAAMSALGAGGPPAFKKGGRVKAGAEGGLGRLQKTAQAKRTYATPKK